MNTGSNDDSLWRIARHCMFPPSSFDAGPAEVTACLRLAKTPRGSDVLDLACGPGRHTLPLARGGFCVTAVDHCRDYLDEIDRHIIAEQLHRSRPLTIELVHCNMIDFSRAESFDLVLSLYHSIGHFRAEEDNSRVLDVLYRSVRGGGAAVVQLVGAESLKRGFQPHIKVDLGDGTQLVQQRKPSADWSWMEVSWTFERGAEQRIFDLSHRIYSGNQLRDALLDAGFAAVTLHGGFDGRDYDRAADKLIAVARRSP